MRGILQSGRERALYVVYMKKLLIPIIVILAAVGLLASLYVTRYEDAQPNHMTQRSQAKPAQPISHIVIIVEENKPAEDIIGNSTAPYINHLLKSSALAGSYYAVAHPSLPNYIALTSGTTAGITNDCNPPGGGCQANVANVADSIEQSGRSWKEYAESMPDACSARNSGEYAVKHNPFLYYPDIANVPARCTSHIVPFSQLSRDLSAQPPDYSFVTPNLCHDMHDCSVATGDTWLSQQVPSILGSSAFTDQRSLLIIVWDEGNTFDNRVAAIFTGSVARPGYTSSNHYTHYSLLHTMEGLWGLPPLTQNDRSAPTMYDMLQ